MQLKRTAPEILVAKRVMAENGLALFNGLIVTLVISRAGLFAFLFRI